MTATAQAHADPRAAVMSETELDTAVRALIRGLGLAAYHTHDSRRSPAGFPDWVIAGPGGLLIRELKRQDGKLTGAQQEWLGLLTRADVNTRVWRPSDLLDGTVSRELTRLARCGKAAR